MTIWRMRIACWILKATNPHSEFVILIVFPVQQWLHERATILRYNTLFVLFKNFIDSSGRCVNAMSFGPTGQVRLYSHRFL